MSKQPLKIVSNHKRKKKDGERVSVGYTFQSLIKHKKYYTEKAEVDNKK
jgi:hypothetical protein